MAESREVSKIVEMARKELVGTAIPEINTTAMIIPLCRILGTRATEEAAVVPESLQQP